MTILKTSHPKLLVAAVLIGLSAMTASAFAALHREQVAVVVAVVAVTAVVVAEAGAVGPRI